MTVPAQHPIIQPAKPQSGQREEPISINPMLLYELHERSLGGDGVTMEPATKLMLEANFGQVERWREEFIACAQGLSGNCGWVLLVYQPGDGRLVHQRAADHTQVVDGGVPILTLALNPPVLQSADGAGAGADIDAFMSNINWAAVYVRYQQAVNAASEPFAASHEDIDGAMVLDVRRASVFEQASTMIPGARWCDPAGIATWSAGIPNDKPLIVYCVFGHEVSRAAALRLRAARLNACFLQGGIDGWRAAGGALVAPVRSPPGTPS